LTAFGFSVKAISTSATDHWLFLLKSLWSLFVEEHPYYHIYDFMK